MKSGSSRIALVTGGTQGIGLECARLLAARGCDVMICGRDAASLATCVSAIEDEVGSARGRLGATVADVGGESGAAEAVAECVRRFGRLDALVNNAAVWTDMALLDITAESWDETLRINLRGAALTSVAAAKQMIAQGDGGRIINIASVIGFIAEAGWPHYSASKAGLLSLTKSMAVELAEYGIRTNAIAPGWIATESTLAYLESERAIDFTRVNPLKRMGTAEEVASVVTFLCIDAPDFMNGAVVTVDGGQMIMASS